MDPLKLIYFGPQNFDFVVTIRLTPFFAPFDRYDRTTLLTIIHHTIRTAPYSTLLQYNTVLYSTVQVRGLKPN